MILMTADLLLVRAEGHEAPVDAGAVDVWQKGASASATSAGV